MAYRMSPQGGALGFSVLLFNCVAICCLVRWPRGRFRRFPVAYFFSHLFAGWSQWSGVVLSVDPGVAKVKFAIIPMGFIIGLD